jgi:transposase InsO family protein
MVQWVVDEATGKPKARAISYKSRRFSERERNWVVGEKEAYACKYALEKFREDILLHPDITLHCDHHNMLSMWSCASAKIARWRLYMQQFEPFKIVHVPGRDNVVADALSRLHIHNLDLPPTAESDDEEAKLAKEGEGGRVDGLMSCTWAQVVSECNSRFISCCNLQRSRPPVSHGEGEAEREPVRLTIARDPNEHALEKALQDAVSITALKDAAEESRPDQSSASDAAAPCKAVQWSSHDQRDAKLLQKCPFPNKRIISIAHDETHPSVATTWARVTRAIGLPPGESGAKLRAEVKAYCDTCLVCAKLKPARDKLESRLGSIRKRPFGQYAFDVIVLSEPDSRGYRYILSVIDSFSGAIELFALKQADVQSVADCLHDVLSRWSRPHSVRCDNAKSFGAAAVKLMLKCARIEQHFVAPYAHVSNGQVENANRRVEYILRAMILDQRLGPASKLSWSRLLPAVRGVLNSRVVGRHGCTPNDLLFGATSQRGTHIYEDEPWMQGVAAVDDTGESLAEHMAGQDIAEWKRQHEILLQKCESVQDELLQRLADAEPSVGLGGRLDPGDTVLLRMAERRHDKLNAPWAGPFLILDSAPSDDGSNVATIQHLSSKRVTRAHVKDLKRCSLDHYSSIDEALPLAALDSFEYLVERILSHRPGGKRKQHGKRPRPKAEYEFEVLWAGLPLEEGENPSWESWSNTSLRSCEAYRTYCKSPEVAAVLGDDFYAGEADGDWDSTTESSDLSRKRQRRKQPRAHQ